MNDGEAYPSLLLLLPRCFLGDDRFLLLVGDGRCGRFLGEDGRCLDGGDCGGGCCRTGEDGCCRGGGDCGGCCRTGEAPI